MKHSMDYPVLPGSGSREHAHSLNLISMEDNLSLHLSAIFIFSVHIRAAFSLSTADNPLPFCPVLAWSKAFCVSLPGSVTCP